MTRTRTGDHALIREINLSVILNALRDHSPLSRAALAVATGLNNTTVSSRVQQMILVGASGVGKRPTGRPAILLPLNSRAGAILGAEIGTDFISLVMTDFAAHVIWRIQESIDHPQDHSVFLRRAPTSIP